MHLDATRKLHLTVIWTMILGAFLVLQGCSSNKDGAAQDASNNPNNKDAAARPGGRRGMGGGPAPVTVRQVTRRDVPIDIQAVGNVEAYLTIAAKSQISGEITQASFQEGDFVKKGDLLFTIDPRGYQAQLNQIQANLARDQAILAQAQANLARDQAQVDYAKAEADRYTNLFERHLVSKEQADQMQTNARAVAAAVSSDNAAILSAQATVKATEAAVENAKVTLGYTIIRSPLNGRTGNLDVKQGNVVSPSMSLMTINQVEPIYVTFSVPEDQLKLIHKGQKVMVSAQEGGAPLQTGELTFIDNTVDATTGTIRLKGTFPNTDHKLWPGQFARVTLRLSIEPNAVVVPNQVVQTGQNGMYVFVVKPDNTVESRPVVTGPRVDQDLVIEKGLEAGETVVLEGQLRLAPGSRVQIAGEGRGQPGSQGSEGGRGRGARGRGRGGDMP